MLTRLFHASFNHLLQMSQNQDPFTEDFRQVTDNMLFLFFGLGLAALAGVVALQRSLPSQSERQRVNELPSDAPEPEYPPLKETWVIVLVISARHEKLLRVLQDQKCITENECDALYRSTQFLWMGTQLEFANSPLNPQIIKELASSEFNHSEYDVHFVRIELNRHESGFEQNASQLDRLDAFNELPMTSKSVRVSRRLPSSAYGQTGVYK